MCGDVVVVSLNPPSNILYHSNTSTGQPLLFQLYRKPIMTCLLDSAFSAAAFFSHVIITCASMGETDAKTPPLLRTWDRIHSARAGK